MKQSRDFRKALAKVWETRETREESDLRNETWALPLLSSCLDFTWASWSEVRNLLSLSAHPQSCVWMSKEFCYHHHTHGQGRPRSPIRQRQCNYNCLQNTRQRLLPVLDIPRAALATTSDATKIKANFNRRWMSNRPIP